MKIRLIIRRPIAVKRVSGDPHTPVPAHQCTHEHRNSTDACAPSMHMPLHIVPQTYIMCNQTTYARIC